MLTLTQLSSNGSRVWFNRRDLRRPSRSRWWSGGEFSVNVGVTSAEDVIGVISELGYRPSLLP